MKNISKLTFIQACKLEGLDSKKVEDGLNKSFTFFSKKDKAAMIAHTMCVIMVKAANRIANGGKEWIADFTNDEYKYEARWWHLGGSSGFRYDDCDTRGSGSGVGSRLCFKTYNAMVDLTSNKVFVKLWNQYAL